MKTFVYARISTEQQTLTQQLNTIENYIKIKGLKIDEIVSDEGVSGGVSYKQRKLNDLLQEMQEGDALVVSEISRLGRSMSDLNKLVNDELKPRKLRLIVISMGMDLDCSNLKAIDEMVLFALGFSAAVEKEMIQERTKSALEARKKKLAEDGYFISKNGNRVTRLGGNGDVSAAARASADKRKEQAKKNPKNEFFYKYLVSYQNRNGEITKDTKKETYENIADELNALGQTTTTGLPYNAKRVQALWKIAKERYSE